MAVRLSQTLGIADSQINGMLIDHPALVAIGEDHRTCVVKMLAHARDAPSHVEVSASEYRAHAVFSRIAELDNCLRSMRIAITELQVQATASEPNLDQYRYHVENYLLRLSGLYDRALRFVGVVMGMPSNQVDHINGNANVIKHLARASVNHVLARLSKLKSLLEPHRDTRNAIAHSSEFSSREIGLFAIVAQVKLELVDPEEIHRLTTHYFREGALDFGMLALQAEGVLYRLIEDLSPAIAASPEAQ